MSGSLYWKHAPKLPADPEDSYLDDRLKAAIRERYGLEQSPPQEVHLTLERDYDYMCGLRDAGVQDAARVIELLRENPEGILLYIQH